MQSELYPVIHFRDLDTTLRNAEIAAVAGSAGLFLIHMEGKDRLLDAAIPAIRARFPALSIGVNRLASGPVDAIRRNSELGADCTWSDTCGVTSQGLASEATLIQDILRGRPSHRFFGSVAFKYQRPEIDPPKAARLAWEAGFVPTTSGDATGSAPSIQKIEGMAAVLGEKVLAVASGVTPENAADFVPFVRSFLVSTGISRSFYEFDASRVSALIQILRVRP